jgi:lipoate-protein ligase A
LERGEPVQLLRRGEQLLDTLADDPSPTVRWYRADTPALVLGRGQADVLGPDLSELGMPVVTRASGGGVLMLDPGVLALDVLVPAGEPLSGDSPGQTAVAIGQAWARGLTELGLDRIAVHRGASQARRRGSPRQRLLAAICYATLGRGEVTAGGRKLVGVAQRRRRTGILVQCGLLRRWEPARLLSLLGADPDDAEVASHAVGLDELATSTPSDEDVITAVTRQLAQSTDLDPGGG